MVNKVFFGRLTPELSNLPRVLWSERFPAIILAGLIILFGLQPNLMIRWSQSQSEVILYGHRQVLNPQKIISLK